MGGSPFTNVLGYTPVGVSPTNKEKPYTPVGNWTFKALYIS